MWSKSRREKHGAFVKNTWLNPAIRAKRVKHFDNPVEIIARREAMKLRHKDSNFEYKIRMGIRRKWKDKTFRARQCALQSRLLKERWRDKEFRRITIRSLKLRGHESIRNLIFYRRSSKYRIKRIEAARKAGRALWRVPGFREAHIARLKASRAKQKFPMKNTNLELNLFQFLDGLKIIYRKHALVTSIDRYHQFDIVIDDGKLLIEADGCYWHSCPKCFPSGKMRSVFDSKKESVHILTKKLGWKLINLWEHQINDGSGLRKLLNILEKRLA